MSVLAGPTRSPANGAQADALVVFLHGYGANGADLLGLADAFAPMLPGAAFASPDAPMDMGMGARAWFHLTMRDPSEYWRGVVAAAPALHRYLDEALAAHRLGADRLALVGFSQGTMMALHVGFRGRVALASVVGFSGLCAQGDEEDAARTAFRPAPTLLIHGTADELVPAQRTLAAAEALCARGVPVEWHMVSGLGHGIDPTGLAMAANHLAVHFSGPASGGI